MTAADDEPERDPGRAKRRRDGDPLGELLPETLIPETTRDESAVGWGDEDDDDPDRQLRREVPPHHG